MFKIKIVGDFLVRFWAVKNTCSTISVLRCPLLVCFTITVYFIHPLTPFPSTPKHTHTLTDQHHQAYSERTEARQLNSSQIFVVNQWSASEGQSHHAE